MSSILKCIAALVVLAVLGVIGGIGFIFSGVYDVAANSPPWPVVAWALHQTDESRLDRVSASVTAPPDLETDVAVKAGAIFYAAHCSVCHGAPGITASPVAAGLMPSAPNLLKATRGNAPAKVFWVVKNGIKMTGMPSFGQTQPDALIWNLAAFLHKERGISAADYAKLASPAANP